MSADRTPLHDAVLQEQIDVVYDLIVQGADVTARDQEERTPMQLAIDIRNLNIIKLLLETNVDEDDKNTCMLMSIKSEYEAALKLLIDAGVDVNTMNQKGFTPLHLAARSGNVNIFKLLIKAGANLDALDHFGDTPLHTAVRKEHLNIIKLLIKSRVDIEKRNNNDSTPFYVTVKSKNLDVFRILMEAGANVNSHNAFIRNTALHRAVNLQNFIIVKALVAAGANVNAKDSNGFTPLHVAASVTDDLFFVKLLIDAGANMDLKNNEGLSPVHMATRNKNFKTLIFFVRSGADVNDARNPYRKPTLMIFTGTCVLMERRSLWWECIKVLMDCTDFNRTNRNGKNFVSRELIKFDEASPDQVFYSKLYLQQIGLMKSLEFHVNSKILRKISRVGEFRNYLEECTQELEKAKATQIHNCWVTFFNLLEDDESKIVKYAGNDDLIRDLEERVSNFPIYGPAIKRTMAKGIKARKLYDDSASILSYHLPIFGPTHLIVAGILDTLTEEDWKKISE